MIISENNLQRFSDNTPFIKSQLYRRCNTNVLQNDLAFENSFLKSETKKNIMYRFYVNIIVLMYLIMQAVFVYHTYSIGSKYT